MKLDEQGKAWGCYFNEITRCKALNDWYGVSGNRCSNCPFFKTKRQFAEDLKKYPAYKK